MIQAKHCDLCENRIANLEKGLTCKLTNRKPDFNNICSVIRLDEKFQEKLEIANLELEIIHRNKKSTHLTFYTTIIIGFSLIIGGYLFSSWTIHNLYLWEVKIGIIVSGFAFLGAAYSKLNSFRRKDNKAQLDKIKIDEILKKYGIKYYPNIDFKEKNHGIQEVIIHLEFKNWAKKKHHNIV
ncbi:hypothetical protein [Dokdonia sp.]|uniref:hypothetical protein n=1 Tax=Dokdonia sp. TaxID=2024995 RepID=UPI003262DFC4